jgi:hypothetical protein
MSKSSFLVAKAQRAPARDYPLAQREGRKAALRDDFRNEELGYG